MQAELAAIDIRTEQVVLPKSELRKGVELHSQSLVGVDSLSGRSDLANGQQRV